MTKISSCQFNIDTACVEVIYENGNKLILNTVQIESALDTDITGRSKLNWLIYNEPTTYVNLILSGEMQGFLDRYSRSQNDIESNVRKSLEKRFSPGIARQIAREFMMYDS